MTIRLLHLLASLAVFIPSSAPAHPDREYPAGTFERADGTLISIVAHSTDGIVFADPVSIQFRLPNGAEVAHTAYASDVALSHSRDHIDLYQFETTFLPIARRIHRFDGYSLSDVSSASRIGFSPFIHVAFHWHGYLLSLGIGAVLIAGWFAVNGMPRRGWLAAVRGLGFVAVLLFSLLYLLILFYGPISPLIVAVLPASAFSFVRNRLRRSTTA